MGQGCALGIIEGCFLGTGQVVGRERKHQRLLRKESDISRARTKCGARHPSKALLEHENSMEDQQFCWEGNLRVSSKVSKTCSFRSEFELSDIALGTGMSGAVFLARPRRSGSYLVALEEEDEACLSSDESPKESREPPSRTPPRPKTPSVADFTGAMTEAHMAQEPSSSSIGPTFKGMRSAPARLDWVGCSELVAVKTLDKEGLSESELQRLLLEVDIYLKMDHVNIAKLLRVFDERNKVYLIMEHCSGGALSDRLVERGHFSEPDAADTVRQMLSAVYYCHSHPDGKVCHRDLKHSNFMYASKAPGAPLKMLDFGLSRVLSSERPKMSRGAGTISYMAPEVLFRHKYNESCDMWSIGVIAYSLLCGKPLFPGDTQEDVATEIARCDLSSMDVPGHWSTVSNSAKWFLRQLLQMDPTKRPTAEQALQHPWLASGGVSGGLGPRAKVQLSRDLLETVRHFAHEHALRRAAAAVLVYSNSAPTCDTLRRLEAQFNALDADGNGTISAQELVQAFQETLGLSADEGSWIFRQLDIDGDTEIHHSEFLTAALGRDLLRREGTVQEVFSRFDLDRDGKIDRREMLSVLGPTFCGTPTHQIFEELDMNGDSAIDMDEFSCMMSEPVGGFQPEFEPPPACGMGDDVLSGR